MRERHNLSMMTFPSAPHPSRAAPAGKPRRAPKANRLPRTLKFNSDFFQIPQILRARLRCMTSFISPVLFSIWDFYFDIFGWHILPARAWTPALMVHLTNPYAKRKVLSLTKPKGKIYKTKSLGHYITQYLCANKLSVTPLKMKLPTNYSLTNHICISI